MRFVSTELGQEVFFREGAQAAPQIRDARRAVGASGRAFSPAPLPVF